MGAIPAATELTIVLVTQKAVACPCGASFKLILPEAKDTPADESPIMICIAINKGIVKKEILLDRAV